jgi:hypothetical protein
VGVDALVIFTAKTPVNYALFYQLINPLPPITMRFSTLVDRSFCCAQATAGGVGQGSRMITCEPFADSVSLIPYVSPLTVFKALRENWYVLWCFFVSLV